MKCIKDSNGVITRVDEDFASEKVSTGKYTYTSKESYKLYSGKKKAD